MTVLSKQTSVAGRISLIGAAFLICVLALISMTLIVMLMRLAQERINNWIDAEVRSIADTLDAHDQSAKLMIERFFKVFSDSFGKAFALDEQNGKLSQLGIALNEYHNPCDKFTDFTGGAAAVLMKTKDGFVAISTSLKEQGDTRAMSFKIGAGHPGLEVLNAGKPYVGRAELYGRPFITRAQPVRDLQNNIVGALFVAFDLTEFDNTLKTSIQKVRFFDTGGVYVLDPKAPSQLSPVVLSAGKLSQALPALQSAARSIGVAYSTTGDGKELSGFEAVLAPGAKDRFAVVRKSSTGLLVVGEASTSEASKKQWAALVPFLALLAAAAAGLCAGLYWLIRKWVALPLGKLTQDLERVSSGDLSVPVQTVRTDEIGSMMRGVESMRMRFVDMLAALKASAHDMSIASSEIASGNQDLSDRTEVTAARLQETSSNMAHICTNVEEALTAARSAEGRSKLASEAAQRGGTAVDQVVECMNSISASSRRITEITSVIDGLAFQTNILSLNAAVEAARAGDSGRGFSVVASEVRTLAARSSAAAKEIRELLQASAAEVQAGHGLAHAARTRMVEIARSVDELAGASRAIAERSAEQTGSLNKVNESVAAVDAMTQQNAALVEQSAAAAASLKAQAVSLVDVMSTFKLEEATRSEELADA